MGNILQNSLDVTYEDFLKGVFGARLKPERTALKSLFSEIVTGKSTLVSDLPRPLRETPLSRRIRDKGDIQSDLYRVSELWYNTHPQDKWDMKV